MDKGPDSRKLEDAVAGGGQGLSEALKELPVEQQKALSSIYLFLVQVRTPTPGCNACSNTLGLCLRH